MTTTDANGIVFYEVTDPVAPLQTLLNVGQSATSAAIGDARRGPYYAADKTERDARLATYGSSATSPLYVDVAGAQWRHNGTAWRPASPILTSRDWDYTTGMVLAPGATYTASAGLTVPDVPAGTLVRVELTVKHTLNANSVQTLDMSPVLTGLTGAWPRSQTSARYPGGTDTTGTTQSIRAVFAAAGGAISVTPRLVVGGGAPSVIVSSAYAEVTLLPGSAVKQATAGV